jgi:PAS domain S-box-containing protein
MNEDKVKKSRLEQAQERISLLEEELEETQKGLNVLSLELENRVEERTKEVEKRLDQFKRLFNGTADAIYIHDGEGNILEVNKQAASRLGYSRDEILEMNLSDLRPETDQSPTPKPEANQVSFETTHLTKGGNKIPVEVNATGINYEDQPAVINIARDVTARKEAEREKEKLLHDVQERYKELSALYLVTRLSISTDHSPEDVIEQSIEKIVNSWQYPEITCARITFRGKEYKSENYRKTDWSQSSDIIAEGERIGIIEVGYLEEKPELDEGPFLEEERELIDSLGMILSQMAEKHRAEERKEHLNDVLRSIRNVNQLIVEENDRDELIEGACNNLVETRGFHHVWIALLDGSNVLVKAAEAGLGGEFKPMVDRLREGKPPGHVERALRSSEVITIKAPEEACHDCPMISNCKDGGILTRRLEYEGKVFGVMSTSIPKRFIGDEEEVGLLDEVASDVSLGLHDIKIEKAHRRSERRYRSLFNSIRDAILVTDTERNVTNCNPAFTELFGYDLEDIKGKKTEYVYHDQEEYEEMGEEIKESIGKSSFFYTIHYEKKSGEVFPGETNVFYMKDEDGEVIGFIGLIRDVSERLNRMEELERSRMQYQAIFESTGTAMSIIEGDTTISMANEEFAELTGYSLEEIEGKMSWREIVAAEDVDRLEEYHYGRRENGEEAPTSYECIVVDKSGDEHIVRNTVGMIPGTKRNVSSIVEITDLVEIEDKLRQSFIELAETTSRVLGVRDPYTQKHEQHVAKLARKVGRQMGLDEDKLLGLYLGGVLHDIGKIAIPETILTKPGELTDIEWNMIKSHPEVGYNQILSDTDFPWPVAEMTLHHHERLDGSGYPDGLEGDELTTEVRILGACDVVEAMSTRRPYRDARSKEQTLNVLKEGKNEKFDPKVVEILVQMIEEGKVKFGGK